MKKEYDVNGKKIVVENGAISINGALALDHVYLHQIREINDAPKSQLDGFKKSGLSPDGRVYISGKIGLFIMQEIAEEAARQTDELNSAKDPKNTIEGYAELVAAYNDRNRYHREHSKMIDAGKSYNIKPVKVNPEDLEKQYPKALAFIKAETYNNSDNYDKSNAGKKAMERIIAGENHETVIEKMESEWMKAAEQAVFNN